MTEEGGSKGEWALVGMKEAILKLILPWLIISLNF